METGTKVNVIPLNMNLPCYNTLDKVTSIMSKNIELDIISYIPLYQTIPKLNLLNYPRAPEKKFSQVIKLKIMQSLHHGTHCDHKTLKRAIPDLSYVPLK